MLLTILFWRAAAPTFESIVKAAQGSKTGVEGDINDKIIRSGEKSLRMGDTMLCQTVNHRDSHRFLNNDMA